MNNSFSKIWRALLEATAEGNSGFEFSVSAQLDQQSEQQEAVGCALNAAFLIALGGAEHPEYQRAVKLLAEYRESEQWSGVAGFYLNGLSSVSEELEEHCAENTEFLARLEEFAAGAEALLPDKKAFAEHCWSLFCPDAAGMRGNEKQCIKTLRDERAVSITELCADPVQNPLDEVLFTSNVLLTIPGNTALEQGLDYGDELNRRIIEAADQPQQFWYDHPIEIGVAPENNEILYGLRNLAQALESERQRGNAGADQMLTCVLSVSTTHTGLRDAASDYLEAELSRCSDCKGLRLYAFSESDVNRLIQEVLAPAAEQYLGSKEAAEQFSVFGVDGEYGRHYSFLKAIAPFWRVFIEPQTKATFKIDLDQVFPQQQLIAETGASALEHLMTPLWGARGTSAAGEPLELGMIAGALVNEKDIPQGLFTPDVNIPKGSLLPEQYVFFQTLPQAVSTHSEMMEVSSGTNQQRCMQRIHVTGGTNGIRVDALHRSRPFTPSFFGRAEDQAYLLSTLPHSGPKLAYLHKAGLIMRHDKESFAVEAIKRARVGKVIGDYIRILNFSAYARVLSADVSAFKKVIAPFTGCFVSETPKTLVYLRFGLAAAGFFAAGKDNEGLEFVKTGATRITDALEFTFGSDNAFRKQYKQEVANWNLYYDTIEAVAQALESGDGFASQLKETARRIVDESLVSNSKR